MEREVERRELIALGIAVGGSALVGAAALALGGDQAVLDELPFDSFLLPALALAVVVGGTALASAGLLLRRHRLGPAAALAAGAVQVLWLFAEVALVGSRAHHLVYGLVGFATLVLGWRLLRAHTDDGRTTT